MLIEKLLSKKRKFDENTEYTSLLCQRDSESAVAYKFEKCLDCFTTLVLNKEAHSMYLLKCLKDLPGHFAKLDASRTWICFWAVHSLELLDVKPPAEIVDGLIDFLSRCQNEKGGFGGGPGQDSHLATTYASVSALCIIGSYDSRAYNVINRTTLKAFIKQCLLNDGSFRMGIDQEVDLRGIYCALAVSRLTNIYSPEVFKQSASYIKTCQNFDGGFGAKPFLESHGGYSFCGYASLALMNHEGSIDEEKLLNYIAHRQLSVEGGFQGRASKPVDSCYSYWVGSIFQIIQGHHLFETDVLLNDIFNREALQCFILICCQSSSGGFYGKPPFESYDIYHTCYSISGLSLAQSSMVDDKKEDVVTGIKENKLVKNHPIYNISLEAVDKAIQFFLDLPNA